MNLMFVMTGLVGTLCHDSTNHAREVEETVGAMIDKLVASTPVGAEEPALVVAFGATANKRRVLSKHATLVGRNRGCDIRVDSPEVSGLHCLISRHPGGLTLRDCDSKSGVIVNGQPVRECELRDGDQLQIGPFSFIVSLPVVPSIASAEAEISPVEALSQQLQDQVEQTKCLQRHIAGVESERDRLAAQIHQLRAELERATFVSDQSGEDASDEVDRYNSLIADHSEQTSQLEQKIEALESDRAMLHQQVQESLRELSKRDQQQSAQNFVSDGSREEIASLSRELDELKSQFTTISQERDRLRESLEASANQVADEPGEVFDRASWLEEEIETLAAERNRLKAELEILRFTNEQSTTEVTGLKEQQASVAQELSDIKLAFEDASNERDRLLREKAEWGTAPQIGSFQDQDLINERDRLAAERDNLSSDLKHIYQELTTAANERETFRSQLISLELERNQWHDQAIQATREVEELHTTIEQLKSVPTVDRTAELKELEDQLATFQQQLTSIADERDRIRGELGQMQNKSVDTDRVDQLEAEMSELVDKLRQVETERVDLQRHLDAEHEQNENRLALLKKQLETERQQMKQLVMQAAAEHDRTRNEMENLRSQLSGYRPPESNSDLSAEETERLLARVAELEAALDAAMHGQPVGDGIAQDMAAYEEQLNQYRVDLEQAQGDLASREADLEQERLDVRERLKQVELDLSRERAALARERADLERIRREFVSEMEHAERESQVRAKLAPVDQLASELKGRSKEPVVINATFSQRLRNLIGRATPNSNKPSGQ